MTSRFPEFDRSQLELAPLASRRHDLDLSQVLSLEPQPRLNPAFEELAVKIHEARRQNAATVFMMGAHVIRAGVQRFLIDLMENGFLKCIATNGACLIHDFELALIGATTESVAKYIKDGRFGFWRETAAINDIVTEAARAGMGLGECVGRAIEKGQFPHKDISIFAAAYRLGIPITVHVGIGYDIVHQLPNCNGAAYGATSYRDFLRFTHVMESLEGGVIMNFGSSVMAPEVYLKALSMARNAARQQGKAIEHFAILVCDLAELPEDYRVEAERDTPGYYFRPWKTMLIRTAHNEADSYYVRGHHAKTVPQLWTSITRERKA